VRVWCVRVWVKCVCVCECVCVFVLSLIEEQGDIFDDAKINNNIFNEHTKCYLIYL
jgi:hypothetical protein